MIALARRHAPAVIRFGLAGALSMSLILAALAGLQAAGLGPRLAYAGALALSLLVNFGVNRHFVFAGASGQCARRQARRYILASLGFRAAEWSLFALIFGATEAPPLMLAILVQGASMLVKYAAFDRFVFPAGR
mgnify:CR=1 FL=1